MADASEGARILVVDDEQLIRETLAEYLDGEGFSVTQCSNAENALRECQTIPFDVALLDVQLPGKDGIALLKEFLKISPETLVMFMTAFATVETAVAAFQLGAHDYLMKPLLLDEVVSKIRRLLEFRKLSLENQWLRRELNREKDREFVIGNSDSMKKVFQLVKKVAATPSNILLLGESGTGKEIVARAIHLQSEQPKSPFLPINCAAIPNDLLENQLFGHRKGAFTGADQDQPGIFVHAGNGTVFLDEIGELPLATQAKLLRVIEQKEVLPVGANEPVKVRARILAATNKKLSRAVEEGTFREDLYYRLNVVHIVIPPLRERREDIPDLVEFLIEKHRKILNKRITGITHEAMQIFLACPWKGNVRELDNAIQRAMILGEGPLITPEDLPPDLAPNREDPALVEDLNEAVRRFEKHHIERIMRQCTDKKEAARRMNVALSSLYRKITDLNIKDVKEE